MHTSSFRSSFKFGRVASYVTAAALSELSDDQIRSAAPAVFAEDKHVSRSERYAYIPTSSLVAGLRREGFVPVEAGQSRSRIPGKTEFTKHMIKFVHADARRPSTVGDSVSQILLINSHDGTSAYKLMLGEYRLACMNGLIVCSNEIESIRVPHSGDIQRQVIEGAFTVIEQSKMIAPRIEAMRAIGLSDREQEIFATQALALRFDTEEGEIAPVATSQVLRARREVDRSNDLWTTFNRVQEHLIKGGDRYVTPARHVLDEQTGRTRYMPARRQVTREVRGIDQNTSLNRALWALTEQMAAIKNGTALAA